MSYDKDWFEFKTIKRRSFDTQAWVPLFTARSIVHEGEPHMVGFVEEYRGTGALAVSVDREVTARQADANDLISSRTSQPYVDNQGSYVRADEAIAFYKDLDGIRLVVEQRIPGIDYCEIDLAQDFVLALNLKREGDKWVRVEEGRDVIARLVRAGNGKPQSLEVKLEHVKDFLSARKMGLALGIFVRRTLIVENEPAFLPWERPTALEENKEAGWRWRGDIIAIHEGGAAQFGSEMRVLQLGRADFDPEDEVPAVGVGEGEFESDSWLVPMGSGRKVYRVAGEIWKTEWIGPADSSPRVAGDTEQSTSYFIVSGDGKKASGDELEGGGLAWIWFRPEIVNEALGCPDGFLNWYSTETGSLGFTPDNGVHFGLNEDGLLMVLAVDVGRLPHWDQSRWAGFNVAPSGGVSKELAAAQAQGKPAETRAPETGIVPLLMRLGRAVQDRFKVNLYSSEINQNILKKAHRFTAVDDDGLLNLAKDLTRLFADRIDAKGLQKATLPQPLAKTVGSLKALEYTLATILTAERAARLCSALFGIYDLRKADAHIPSSDLDEDYRRANVDRRKPVVWQGHDMLLAFVATLSRIATIIERSEREAA